jgi:hypothetical protein
MCVYFYTQKILHFGLDTLLNHAHTSHLIKQKKKIREMKFYDVEKKKEVQRTQTHSRK